MCCICRGPGRSLASPLTDSSLFPHEDLTARGSYSARACRARVLDSTVACGPGSSPRHRLNSAGAFTDYRTVEMTRRLRQYVAVFRHPDGVTDKYVFTATSRRRAKADAQVCAAVWDVTLVEITPAEATQGRRLLALAGVTLVVSGTTIAAVMLVGLKLEGTP